MNARTLMARAMREAARRMQGNQDVTPEDLAERAADILHEWEIDAALEREQFGEPEDTPCLQSCDFWGTGEGRNHGVIG